MKEPLTTFPDRIYFLNDFTTADFVEEIHDKKNKTVVGKYVYLDGFYMKGRFIEFSLDHLKKLLGNQGIAIAAP